MECPKCGSNEISGLVAPFWVQVDSEGFEPERPLLEDVESSTELTDQRRCRECEHEWEAG